jgi:hypothetical protein
MFIGIKISQLVELGKMRMKLIPDASKTFGVWRLALNARNGTKYYQASNNQYPAGWNV